MPVSPGIKMDIYFTLFFYTYTSYPFDLIKHMYTYTSYPIDLNTD